MTYTQNIKPTQKIAAYILMIVAVAFFIFSNIYKSNLILKRENQLIQQIETNISTTLNYLYNKTLRQIFCLHYAKNALLKYLKQYFQYTQLLMGNSYEFYDDIFTKFIFNFRNV